jgi:hypothetical protein
MMKPPPGVSEEEPPDMSVEEALAPTFPQSHPMKPPPDAREEKRCGDG